MNHFSNPTYAAPAAAIRCLNSDETKESIDAWYNQCRAFCRAIPAYSRYIDLSWTSHGQSKTRGFADITEGTVKLTAQ